jgi:uncharacterized protein YdeI (YjbR/CyaY-like superfamily)
MNTNVDTYFSEGCGRCSFAGTPQCKVNKWPQELKQLRRIVLECGLSEESKWGVPCYTFNKKNIAIVSAFKEYCALSFFKGALLNNAQKLLEKPGENSQAARLIKFTSVNKILSIETLLKAYIFEAIEIEKAGLQVKTKTISDYNIPDEFQQKLNEITILKEAFNSLTPGRKKSYLIYFSQAKQVKTRESRIEKCIPQILKGKGFNER